MTLGRRRLRNLGITGLAAITLAIVVHSYEISLRDSAFLDGWLLAIGMVFLGLYNLRKKIAVLPVLSSAGWLQAHIYVGVLCTFLFLNHTDYRLPNGVLEITLWTLFVALVGSGVIGLAITRRLPAVLSARGERVIFERIPGLRAKIESEVQDLAIRAAEQSGSQTIPNFYARRVHPFLRKPRNFWAHLLGHDAPLRRVISAIREQHRYQDADGRAILNEMEALVTAKHALDHQFALQLTLKLWLFVHIPLTYSICLVTLTHIVLVYAFNSGAP